MLKHQKKANHKFGEIKRNDRIIKDMLNCKKCHEINEKHKCIVVVPENNDNVIYSTNAE